MRSIGIAVAAATTTTTTVVFSSLVVVLAQGTRRTIPLVVGGG